MLDLRKEATVVDNDGRQSLQGDASMGGEKARERQKFIGRFHEQYNVGRISCFQGEISKIPKLTILRDIPCMTAIDMDAFIARIDERQAALGGLSDRATCIAAGINPHVLYDIRRKKSEPSAGRLLALARALGCSTDYLLTGRNPPSDETSHEADSEDLSILQQLHALPNEQQAVIRRMLTPVADVSPEDLGILRQLHSLSPEQQAMIRRMLIPVDQLEVDRLEKFHVKGKR